MKKSCDGDKRKNDFGTRGSRKSGGSKEPWRVS